MPEPLFNALLISMCMSEISGNQLLKVVPEAVLSWNCKHPASVSYWSGKEETALLEHERIIDYLAANEAQSAVKIITAHPDRSDRIVR